MWATELSRLLEPSWGLIPRSILTLNDDLTFFALRLMVIFINFRNRKLRQDENVPSHQEVPFRKKKFLNGNERRRVRHYHMQLHRKTLSTATSPGSIGIVKRESLALKTARKLQRSIV